MHDCYGSRGFLAAYNAGPDRYEDHLTTGRPLPVETRGYVAKVGAKLGLYREDRATRVKLAAIEEKPWTQGPLFFVTEFI
jgi:soluble lytic murein transglycosylase-like protein